VVTVFADDLDVPIGLYPCVDRAGHDGAIVFSIPNIWRLWDDDGDGRADRREVLYGPMGWERDAHGLNNSFRRGFDGWIYANHGYNNITTVKGSDGHEIHMESGNTYRFRIDGSRIEQFTFGQVNPFGSCFDERGDLYTADCHTLPITLLVRGGCYESFGKPSDGLGFTPQIMKHLHGSTALCGLAITTGDLFPSEWRERLFVGNVMTCRVHCDQLVFDGSTPRAVEQPDFVVSDDPWFRPVDLQFGPTARCTSPTSTTGSSGTTKSRWIIPAATVRADASGASPSRARARASEDRRERRISAPRPPKSSSGTSRART
jgi:glucose/arabinose dehydrogenase